MSQVSHDLHKNLLLAYPRTSNTSNWKGLTQDHITVLVTDLFIISMGALYLSSPVSFRIALAFRLSNTGA